MKYALFLKMSCIFFYFSPLVVIRIFRRFFFIDFACHQPKTTNLKQLHLAYNYKQFIYLNLIHFIYKWITQTKHTFHFLVMILGVPKEAVTFRTSDKKLSLLYTNVKTLTSFYTKLNWKKLHSDCWKSICDVLLEPGIEVSL